MKARTARALVTAGLGLGLLLGAAPTAQATFHLMKVREVSAGTGVFETGYVELQMIASGQTELGGHNLNFYDAAGNLAETCPLSSVPLGNNQRTIVVGDTAVPSGQRDILCTGLNVLAAAGAVCFAEASPPDCVSWGGAGFTGSGLLPSPGAGTPFSGAIPDNMALRRTAERGCPTSLEDADDTNSSTADFALAAYAPTPNSTTPTETLCPTPAKKSKCKKKKKKKKGKGKAAASAKKKCKKKKK